VAADIARRDHVDATRADSPMTVPDGATLIDTSGLSIDQVADAVLAKVKEAESR
jgi:cytidylate kinase